jgi:hypothetical protein
MAKIPKHLEKKRHGLHHKQSNRYHKVYWPYLPLTLALLLSFTLIWVRQPGSGGVLSYATDISSSGLLTATNSQRTKNGAQALKINSQLAAAAQAKAEDMATRNYWSHLTPEGKEPWIFIDRTGYDYLKAGENLAYGFSSSNKTVAGWMNSKSHRANLLDVRYLDVGFGFANSPDYQKEGPETIVVALYGQPSPASAVAGSANQASPRVQADSTHPVTSAVSWSEPLSKQVALVQTLTGGDMPWSFFAVGVMSGGAISLLLLRHGLKLRKLLRKSEGFVLHHPIYDTGLVLVIIAGIILSKGVGFVR